MKTCFSGLNSLMMDVFAANQEVLLICRKKKNEVIWVNHSFYKKAICLLLASSVTFGPAVGPLSAHALEELSAQMADQMTELPPTQDGSSLPMMELTPAQGTESTPAAPEKPMTDEEQAEKPAEPEEQPQTPAEQDEQPQAPAEQDEPSKLPEQELPAFTGKNLAQEQGVQVSASHTAEGSDAAHARDGQGDSAWKAEAQDGQVSLSYDLKGLCALEGVQIQWESTDSIREYFVETSINGDDWDTQIHHTSAPAQKDERIPFQNEVEAQHIRLRLVTTEDSSAVGVQELGVYGNKKPSAPVLMQSAEALPAGTNLARQEGVTATQSDVETDTQFTAEKARDGDRTSRSSRWATNVNASKPTITYDLGQTRTIGGVVIYWEKPSATNYFVETSANGEKWDTQVTLTKRVSENGTVEKIDFPKAVEAQHVRVRIEQYENIDTGWNNVSMYEFEVYQEAPSTIKDASSVAEGIKPREQDGKLV